MLTREQKETMLNQILELMTAIAYDEPVENAPAPEKKPEKVKMLTVRECTELIDGLSEHTVQYACGSEQDQVYPHRRGSPWQDTCQ